MSTNEARDAAIREAKRYIHDIVRNDWCFEPSITSATGRPRFETSWPVGEQEVAEWRLRDYDDSSSELEPQAEDEEEEEEEEEESQRSDDEGRDGEHRAVMIGSGGESEGRRKRRRQMEEEMSWNEGLRTWMERRDAWSGARTRREIRSRRDDAKSRSVDAANGDHHAEEVKSAVAGETQGIEPSTIDPSDVASKTESSLSISGKDGKTDTGAQPDKEDDDKEKPPQLVDPHHNHHHNHHHHHSHHHHHYDLDQTSPLIPDEPYIPVVPSIISSTNPIRASITSSMYPSIYSKVIVQSLTPTVPINLADVTKAMVQGWKADGQWPAPPKHTSIVLQDDATVRRKDDGKPGAAAAAAAGGGGASSPETVKKKSGVASAVRKVLHFSGFHPHHHPFHRRGSSHGSNSQHQLGDGEAGPSNIH